MAIDNINNRPVNDGRNVKGNANATGGNAQANASQQAQQQQTAQQSRAADSVLLTSGMAKARQVQQSASSGGMEVNQKKVESIKKMINEGVYKVDADRLASKIIQFESDLFDD